MEPVDLPLLMPHADLRDVEFLRTMLRLDPAQRVTAQQACNDSYFTEYPLPSRLSELPVPSRDKGEKRIDREAGTGAVILKDRKEVEEFLSKMIRQPVVHS
jgi:serine/threonine protein kinase